MLSFFHPCISRPFAIRVTKIAFIANDDIIISITFCCDFIMQIFFPVSSFSFSRYYARYGCCCICCTTLKSFLHILCYVKKGNSSFGSTQLKHFRGNISPFFIPDDLFFCIQNQHNFFFFGFCCCMECLSSHFFVLHFTPSVIILLGYTCTQTINKQTHILKHNIGQFQ